MTPALLARLDALWATHLRCQPADLRSQNTLIISDSTRTGATICLIGGTCVMAAAPAVAAALKQSVGMRAPAQAFEPGRLRYATADFALPLFGPEAVMVAETPENNWNKIQRIEPGDSETDVRAAVSMATGIPLMTVPLQRRPTRLIAESCGFKLYAALIHLGEGFNL
ncbi:MAG: hypothetical protein HYZ49_08210 [Chloroflexi bacterium]|nr:hypothetical protein [Chloroflexota bacterium]